MAIEKTPIGLRLASYRKACGFKNAEELANAVDSELVTRSTIVNVELGRKKDLTVTELLLISRALKISPISLMFDVRDLFSVEADYPGFEDAFRFQLIQWVSGINSTFIGASMPAENDEAILEHFRYAVEHSASAEAALEEAEGFKNSDNPLEQEMSDTLIKTAKTFSKAAEVELKSIELYMGKPVPEHVRSVLLLERVNYG